MTVMLVARAEDWRVRLLDAADRWEADADLEDARIGRAGVELGLGRGFFMRRVAAGFRDVATSRVRR